MVQMPSALAAAYRLATDREVRSWSYGALNALRNPAAQGWEQQRGTLDDQGIFGPLHEFECACSKYRGRRYRGMICDRCFVKLTTPAARRRRFAHIELPEPVQHPLGGPADLLSVFPVLPVSFIESRGGQPLASVYEDLIRCAAAPGEQGLRQDLERLAELVLPIAAAARQWRLIDAATLARGLALEDRLAPVDARCGQCGFPIEGLHLAACPHCGSRLLST